MLFDEVVSLAGTEADAQFCGAFSGMREWITQAERFNFEGSAVSAIYQVANTRPSSLLKAIQLCRLPFHTCWFEWSCGDAETLLRPGDTSPVPRRTGVLLEDMYGDKLWIRATYVFWHRLENLEPGLSGASRGIAPCAVSYIANFADLDEHWLGVEKKVWPNGRPFYPGDYSDVCVDPAEADALRQLLRRTFSQSCTYMEPLLKQLSPEEREAALAASSADLLGEPQVLMAALSLINSRSGVSKEAVDLQKLNRQRTKGGKLPLLSYSTVKMKLSRRDSRIAQSEGTEPAMIRQHIVRGHFKIRKSGIYWWRPYLRGTSEAGVVVRSGYTVVN